MTSLAATTPTPTRGSDLITLWKNLFEAQERILRDRDDPEAVHDARVASRRLRTAMEAAAPSHSQKWFRSLNSDAKSYTRLLGRLRDADVMLGQVSKSLEQADDKGEAGWRYLYKQLSRERRQERKDVVRRLKRFDADYRKMVVRRLTNATARNGQGSQMLNPDPSFLASRAGHVVAFDAAIRKATDPSPFHDLRIETKHLRYALELASPAPDPTLVEALKRLQESLGNLHDCDVRIERLGQEAESLTEHKNSDPQTVASLRYLEEEEAKRRDNLRIEALAAWTKLRRGNLRKQLDALANPMPSAPVSPSPNGHRPSEASLEQQMRSSAPAMG